LSKEVILHGKVISGDEKGKRFVNLLWVKRQLKEKLGFNPYPGTLNLQLANEKNIHELRRAEGITLEPEKGYFKGKCFKALVMKKIEGAVVLPDVPEYPPDLLEILAPVNLRKTLRLKDGMELVVTVKID
jgi:riboflavin kinase